MTAAGHVSPEAYDPRARLRAGYETWDTERLRAELADDERDLRTARGISPEARQHTELRAGVLRAIIAGREAGHDHMTTGLQPGGCAPSPPGRDAGDSPASAADRPGGRDRRGPVPPSGR